MAKIAKNGSIRWGRTILGGVWPILVSGLSYSEESSLFPASAETTCGLRNIVFAISEVEADPARKMPLSERLPTKEAEAQNPGKEAPNAIELKKASTGFESRMQALQKPLGSIDFSIAADASKTPTNAASQMPMTTSPFFVTSLSRATPAPNRYPIFAHHNPLYFEDINLERCGTTYGCAQTAVSAAKFFTQAALLPYRMFDRPWCTIECDRVDCQACSVNCATPLRAPCNSVQATGEELCATEGSSAQPNLPSTAGKLD